MRKTKGFTLVELLAVIVILGLLIGIAIPVYFNITRTVKGNEYESKKKYIEGIATNYAEEHNITTSLVFTPSRLIANGYMSADKYVNENGEEIPFIINPADNKENLACRIINLSINDYDYTAEMTDQSDCSLASEEVVAVNMGIEAYRLDGNTIGNKIGIDGKTFDWVNSDVLLVINPKYQTDDIIIAANGNSTVVDKSNMLSNPSPGMILNNNYSNVVVIRAEKILKSEVSINIKAGDGIKTATVGVRIDKETPVVNSEKFDGWVGVKKTTLVYLSDGSGSGPDGVYVTATPEFNDKNYYRVGSNSDNLNTALIDHGLNEGETGLSNGTYYLWPKDKAGNVANKPTPLEIKNVDLNPPTIGKITWDIDSDVSNPITGEQGGSNRKTGIDSAVEYDRVRKAIVSIIDLESGMQKTNYCVTTGDSCTPDRDVTSLNDDYTFTWDNLRDAQKICYNATDNVGNVSDTVCTNKYLVDGTLANIYDYSYDNLRTIKFKPIDNESGVYKYYARAVNKSNSNNVRTCEGRTDYYDEKFYDCIFRYLTAYKTYTVYLDVYNRANSVYTYTQDIFTNYTVNSGYQLCTPQNNWCTGDDFENGVFVKYGSYQFVLYKYDGSSVFGVGSKNNMVTCLIDQSCCDHGKCHAPYITRSSVSGIWGNSSDKHSTGLTMLSYYNNLPSNRNYVAMNKTWYVEILNRSQIPLADYSEKSSYKMFSYDSIEANIYNGYTYYYPNRDVQGVSCYYRTQQQKMNGETGNEIPTSGLTVRVGSNKEFKPGIIYDFYCTKPKSNNEIDLEVKNIYYTRYGKDYRENDTVREGFIIISSNEAYERIKNNVDKFNRISRDVYAAINNPADDSIVVFHPSLTLASTNNHISTSNGYTYTARYGLLTYTDFANLRPRAYFRKMNGGSGISTLLSAYIPGVLFAQDFQGVIQSGYGHDGVYSSISGFIGSLDGYRATTPMRYGVTTAALVIPFNPNAQFVDGTGQESDPFIVSTSWR